MIRGLGGLPRALCSTTAYRLSARCPRTPCGSRRRCPPPPWSGHCQKGVSRSTCPPSSVSVGRRAMGAFASKTSSDVEDASPYLVVGLGNPGPKYSDNRHNVGFMAIDAFASHHGLDFKGLQKSCHVARGVVHGSKVLLAKPMTFMNNSGEGVSQLMKYYKIPLERVVVLVDDLDTAPGAVKLKKAGGHGGQNGIRSIIDMVGSREFARVKIGIGRPREGQDVVGHVLSNFTKDEAEGLPAQLEEVRHVVEAVIGLGMEKALGGGRIVDEEERKRKREARLRRKREAEEARKAKEAEEASDGEGGESGENEPVNKKQEVEV